ncbi:DNA mismatch repair protein MutS [Hoylesella buccalis]|uniref:MutS-related protein n=1 Tax=Hoylesella buccalis TaxID=28127 RepID=UPI001D08BDC1|nr:DNA mismatch repair protein MutS [Hoylesella buccalis]MCB6901639.1 DNA mismatch repair protein MutS [Hoylesella buccalis]UEA61815.1 DNA mismatch repair protein MutS [Hoylesella buccalis]UWP48468.1 DNA mismatch repair protein MutS [Hoylesella buccalis ATCC 35310]
MNLSIFYTEKERRLAGEIAQLKQKSRLFVAGQIVFFLLFLAFLVLYTLVSWGALPLVLSAISLLLYALVRLMDVKNDEQVHRFSNLRKVYLHELSYLNGDFSCFNDGERYVDAHHPFTFDLDVFGKDSLFQRINRTVTTGGSDWLAAQLSSVANRSARAEAVDELASMEPWRATFMALGADGRIDSALIRQALQEIKSLQIPTFAARRWTFVLACLLIVGLFAAVVASVAGWVSAQLPLWWGILHFFGVFFVCSGACRVISKAVDKLHEQLQVYVELIRQVSETTAFTTPQNAAIVDVLQGARQSFDQLNDILNGLDRRGNILGLFLMDALFLSDYFLVRRFLRWQRQYLGQVPVWIDAISEIDGLVSMATFRYNEPQAGRAEVVASEEMVYEAVGLYHPFLGAKAVRNDFTLQHRHYYIITGANMAGKSTFLRALGINYILAMNGMPVFATSLRVSAYSLFSSMRTTDDLAHGISYFNAELLRLKQLLTACQHNSQTLIILDEILKGTNSADKLNGSRLFLQAVSALPVTGVIATHDLELSKMAGVRFHNYCFEIALGQDVTYSYKITPGIARNQNATFLLREILSGV